MKLLGTYGVGLLFALSLMTQLPASACNECHSKNPKMVKMHKELQGKNCFTCHSFKGKKSAEELKKQVAEDVLCSACHSSAKQ